MKTHWPNVMSTVHVLGEMLTGKDPDGMELYFMSSPNKNKSKNASTLVNFCRANAPREGCTEYTEISARLSTILFEYQKNIEPRGMRAIWRKIRPVRPLNVYVLTDGKWEYKSDPRKCIKSLATKLDGAESFPQDACGIQFIQYGHDTRGKERLEYLDSKQKMQLNRYVLLSCA